MTTTTETPRVRESTIVACPACERQVSRLAPTCPACGHPISKADSRDIDADRRKAAWILGPLTLALLVAAAYFGWIQPEPVMRLAMALCAGFMVYLMSGTITASHSLIGTAIRATGGTAVFILLQVVVDPTQVIGNVSSSLGFERFKPTSATVGQPTHMSVTLINNGPRSIRGDHTIEWYVADSLIQHDTKSMNLARRGEIQAFAAWLPTKAGQAAIEWVVKKAGIRIAKGNAAVMVAAAPLPGDVPKPSGSPPSDTTSPFLGRWFIDFTFERNTGRPDEGPYTWYSFETDFTQREDSVFGTLKAGDITGELQGVIAAGQLSGRMKLSWDRDWWQSITLNLAQDGNAASGTAVVYDRNSGESHFYSTKARRVNPAPL